jgi:choline dehydrogenase
MPGKGGRMVPLPRGRLVGGSSAVNGTFALRGFPEDYDEWAYAGNDDWSFADVLPMFRALENDLDYGDEPWHGDTGQVPIRRYMPQEMSLGARALLESAVAVGHKDVPDHNRPGATGAGALPVNTIGGVRMSTALTHLATARTRANLTVRPGVLIDRIDVNRGQARGVRLADGELLVADLVILAAGAYGSPVIMLRSGLGPAGELGALGIGVQADLPGVGSNLVDHPLASVALPSPAEPRRTARYQTMVTLASPQSNRPDLHIFEAGPFETDSRAARGGAVLGVGLALVKPDSRGTVRLASTDPDAPPRIDPAHLRAPRDRKRMLFALQEARRLARTAPLSELVIGSELAPAPGIGDHDTRRLTAALAGQVWSYHHPG